MLFGNLTRRPSSDTPSTGSANVNAVSSDNALATADSGDSRCAAIAENVAVFRWVEQSAGIGQVRIC